MKKFVAFAVATLFTAGASVAMAQCATCSGNAAPVFSSQPVYAAPAAPVYSQPVYAAPAAPIYSQPIVSAPAYSEPIVSAAPVYSEPIASAAPVYSQPVDNCGCGSTGGEVILGDQSFGGEATFTGGEFASYGQGGSDLTVGSVINGETVISVGETEIVGTTDPGEGGNVIDGSVEPSPDGGEVVSPPAEGSSPAPDDMKKEMMEGDA